MAKQASTVLIVINGPAELSVPPSSPMTAGGFSHVIHQVRVPTPVICLESNSLFQKTLTM